VKDIVRAGDHRVGKGEGSFVVQGLGSCVAVMLYDDEERVAGLVHVLLPDPTFSTSPDRRMRFATTAVPDLLEEMERLGGRRDRISARLVGGASMFRELLPRDRPSMGERNVRAARSALGEAGIPILGEDVGGDYGRTVHFDVGSGLVRVATAKRDDVLI
jgi:chemotaxis protein CheD